MKLKIFEETSDSFGQKVFEKLGKGKQHAMLVYKEWFKTGMVAGQGNEFDNAQVLFEQIVEMTEWQKPICSKQSGSEAAQKYCIVTVDGFEIEMVVLQMPRGKTLCVSSQIGCQRGCRFCETAKMGLVRNLSRGEIVGQLFTAIHTLGHKIDNIVFMGMGEPLDNYQELKGAIEIICDGKGFGLGHRQITVSTSGVVDKVFQMIEDGFPPVHLAVSLNGFSDEVRSKLMPINRTYDMAALREAMVAYSSYSNRPIFVEYVMIEGKTDQPEAVEMLANYLKGLDVTINLIPYNSQSNPRYTAPSQETIFGFSNQLRDRGFLTFIRGTKGDNIMAACGQLGNLEFRMQKRSNAKNSLEFSVQEDILCL